jgi:hypothetical protein
MAAAIAINYGTQMEEACGLLQALSGIIYQ